ncbi:MAG: proton-conducting transporter membrane subunit, partial [Acidobacteriota bacterium]
PVYATIFLISTRSSIGMPVLNGFIGEFTILQGVFQVNKFWAAWAVAGIVLGAAYMLWLYQRTMFGACDNPKNQVLKDLSLREMATLVPLVIWAFWIGLYPKPYFEVLEPAVTHIVERVNPGLIEARKAGAPQVYEKISLPLEKLNSEADTREMRIEEKGAAAQAPSSAPVVPHSPIATQSPIATHSSHSSHSSIAAPLPAFRKLSDPPPAGL